MKSTIAAIDFGTSKIVTLVAETSGSQRCDIVGAGISMYDGFLDGEWNNTMALNEAIQKSISEAENQSKRKIREINVGVPGEFTRVYAVETSVTIQGADPRVTPRHVEKIFANAEFTEDREARMHDEQESQNNFQKLEELSREMGQKTAETIEDAIDTLKTDAEK